MDLIQNVILKNSLAVKCFAGHSSKNGHHPNLCKHGLDPKCNIHKWLGVKFFAGHSPKSGQHPKWFKNGFDPRCNIYKCTCSKMLCWTFSKKVDIIQTGLNRDLDNPHWVQMHLGKSHGLLLQCLLLGQSSSFSAILFQMLPRLTPWSILRQ